MSRRIDYTGTPDIKFMLDYSFSLICITMLCFCFCRADASCHASTPGRDMKRSHLLARAINIARSIMFAQRISVKKKREKKKNELNVNSN